jgi:hypothetical protein
VLAPRCRADRAERRCVGRRSSCLAGPATFTSRSGALIRNWIGCRGHWGLESKPSHVRRLTTMCTKPESDGDRNAPSQRSLSTFNKYAGTKVDTKLASLEALNAIKAKPGHVCPLICERGLKAGADTCVKITCRAGYRVNDDNECEKVQDKKPVATRDDKNKRDLERKQIEAAPPKVEAKPSGQSLCNTAGCRPVRSGCRLGGGLQNGFQREYCN